MTLGPSHLPEVCGGLIDKIDKGDCVLVLGPRIAMPEAVCGDRKPIDEYLAAKLVERLGQQPASEVSLREALTHFERRFGPVMLRSVMKQLVSQLDEQSTPLHRDLASLPFRLILMATPDRMMQAALKTVGKESVREDCYDYTKTTFAQKLASLPSSDAPIVYHLFGNHLEPQSMVLTDKNLLDYLVQLTRESPPLPDPIRATLRSPATQFLFIGFGFTNWWLRLLLKVLDVTGIDSRTLSLALEDARSFQTQAAIENKAFFEVSGIYVDAGDWEALARELAARYRDSVRAAEAPIATSADLKGRSPLVFLSYASEDLDTANRIRRRLDAHGISVWQDTQNLRVGQTWRTKIAEFIKRVDYFVFIQTENMDRRTIRREDGVYNYELKVALDRSTYRPSGDVFVLHVTVGRCNPRPEQELADLHHIAVDDDEGVDRLASEILESFASTPEARSVQAAQAA